MVFVSQEWGVSISTNETSRGLSANLQAAATLSGQLPNLLRQLDQSLGTSFSPPGGRTFPLDFPAQPSYLLSGGAASAPFYRPSSMLLSGDSTLALSNTTWQSWTAQSAEGIGTVMVNLCTPTARQATGKATRPASVPRSRTTSAPTHPSARSHFPT